MAEEGRLTEALTRFVQQVNPGIDYCAQYPGTIVKQIGQLFDFEPDSDLVPGIQGIPLDVGVPGVTFTVDVSKSPRATLYFAGQDPSQPRLALAGLPGLLTLQIGQGATLAPAARSGDSVQVTIPPGSLTLAVSGGSATGPAAPLNLSGTVTSGSAITGIA